MIYKRGFSNIILIIALFVVIVLAGISYLMVKRPKPETFKPTPTPILDETADWKTYRNEKLGFEFKYPIFMYEMIEEEKIAVGDDKDDVIIGFTEDISRKDELPTGYLVARLQNKQFDPYNII